MLHASLGLAGGLILLYLGAEGLVRGSAALALRFGLTPLVIGLTVVAFGTSSPELVVSLQATLDGNGEIALGNIIGSNICNVGLILGLSALVRPLQVHVQLLRMDVPILIGCSVLLLLLLTDEGLARWEGLLLVTGIVGYTWLNIRLSRREGKEVQEEFAELFPAPRGKTWRDVLFVVAGLALLVFGADLLVDGAITIAEGIGLSQAVIGLTIVAIGTSLPELATSVVAAVKAEGDIAIGNVVGSSVFNILCILGLTSLVRPLVAGGIGLLDLGAMVFVSLLLLPLMRTGFRVSRLEGGLLLVLYAGYLVFLLRQAEGI